MKTAKEIRNLQKSVKQNLTDAWLAKVERAIIAHIQDPYNSICSLEFKVDADIRANLAAVLRDLGYEVEEVGPNNLYIGW